MSTPIADMVAEMLACGIAADIIVMAVKAAEQAASLRGNSGGIPVDAAAEKRRAYDRDRKRAKVNSGGIPVETPRNSDPALNLTSPSQKTDQEKEVKKVRARKHPLPPEWQPSEVHFEAASKLKIPRGGVLEKAEDMRLWAAANGTLKLNWDATFHGFLRRDASKFSANGKQNGQSVVAAADRLLEDVRALSRPAPPELELLQPGVRGGEGAVDVRLLSQGRRE